MDKILDSVPNAEKNNLKPWGEPLRPSAAIPESSTSWLSGVCVFLPEEKQLLCFQHYNLILKVFFHCIYLLCVWGM